MRENAYHLRVEVREPKTFTKRLTDDERNAARSRLAQSRRDAKDAARKAKKKANRPAITRQDKRKAVKAAQIAIARAKPASKPVSFNSTWHTYKPGMTSAEFCRTREWAEIRHKVLVKYGATCQCCGASRQTGAILHVDHIKPRSKYPALELIEDNLQVLCELCNIGKSNTNETDWR